MKEPNKPGSSSGGPNSGGNQSPAFPAQSTSTGVRPSFTVLGPLPHGQPLPPPTIARTVPQVPNVPPQQIQVETLLHTLSDANNLRIESKVQCLREFLDNYDDLVASATYINNVRSFISMLIRLLSETTAQFIGENETHRLRKLILEVFQRMSLGENVRQFARELQKLLLGVILHDNEENALLAIKIMIDHSRGFRLQFSPEITNFFAQVRTAYRAFIEDTIQDAEIFNQSSSTQIESIDYALQYLLPNIHSIRSVYLEQRGTRSTYTLIPLATHSIRVFSELAIFLLNLNQMHRQNVFEEVMELLPIIVNFVCMQVPPSPGSNKPLVDEFHTAQIRALSFLAYIAKSAQTRQQNYTQRALIVLEESSEQLVVAINQLLENLNPYVTASRRDFIMAIKSFIESDLKHKFVGIIPRLISDRYLLGEKFTSQDHFRYFLYHNLADLLYKIRQHLSYPMLLNAFKVCIRCIHDNQLAPNYQMMYLKLMRSLCEPIIEHENRLNEPAREILVLSLEALIKKLQVIADHYLPTLSIQLGKVSSKKEVQYPPISPQKDQTVSPQKESLAETRTDSKDADAADTKPPTDANQLPQWQDQPPPVTPSDCRNMIKYIFLPVQEITSKLAKCHVTEETSMYSERQLFEQFFVQSIRCLEIFKIVLAAASSQPSQVSAQLKSSLAKDEKETVETFALVFYDADPKLFRYIFGRQINFFIDAFIANTSVQLVCKLFLLSDKTFTSTGSILMKHMLKHMSELGVSGQISSSSSTSDKTNVYLRLFREIFHIVSGLNNDQQPQRVSVTATERQARSKEHEAMLIPYLHQIVSDSIQLALRSRDPNHYFALLHALFRSIGTGSHDQLYQQFLPLLPSILQQLNRFQNGSYRQPIHDLYVELCLTVPVRLSSLLPYLPKLMDPLVCALNGTSKLVMQGLRTLELFVNNLQLDYIYDQMLPVRAALMQGIWRALYTQELHYAMLALKILGKLGGSSRRAFMDPQNFTYVDLEDIGRSIGPRALYAAGHASYNCEPPKLCVQTELTITQKPDTTTKSADTGPQKRKLDNGTESEETVSKKQQLDEEKTEPIAAESDTKEATEQSEQVTEEPKLQVTAQLPMAQLVDSALTMIRSSMVNEPTPALNLNWAHWIAAASQFVTNTQTTPGKVPKQQAVELCKSIVLQSIKESPLLKLHSEEKLKPLFQKAMQAYNEQKNQQKQSYQCENSKSRAVIGSALTGLFYAAVSSELRPQSLSVYRAIISHLTLQALLESMAVDLSELEEQMEVDGQAPLQQPRDLLDASILIDVICQTLSDSCKHFAQAGIVALRFINIILKSLFDTPEELNQAYELPFFDVLLKRIHQLSCRRDWFCKLGGCTALRFFVDNFTREFVLRNVELFMQSFFTTISGLADEVSYGAVDVACKAMDQLIDVCAGVNEDEKRDFDAHSLHEFVQLVSSNLTNAEQQIRAEVNRLLVRLLELTGKTKLELLCGNVEHLKQVLLSGFVQFSSMSIGSQLGLLDFMHQHLIDLQLVTDPSYVDQSLAFVSNLMTIIENTDIALHSMPSSRYSITNLPGGSHSLEDQMRFLRVASLQALGQHSLALLSLKQKLEQSISSDELEMERLNLALSAIDLNQIQIDANGSNPDNEKQLERMRWTLRYASQLANVQFDEFKKQPTRAQMSKLKSQLKEMVKNLKNDSDLAPNSQSAQRQRLIEKLDAIVEFLLKLTVHPVHPQKTECRDLLEKILTNEPRFKLRIHAELTKQFQQMQPFVMLNNEVENPVTYLEDSLNAKDRMSFLAHSIIGDDLPQHIRTVSDGTGDGLMNDSGANSTLGYQPPALICVDLNDPAVLGGLLEGQLSVQLEDQDGKVIAVGETIAFAPVTEKSKHKVRQPSESALIRHTKELADFVNDEEEQLMEESQSTEETTSEDLQEKTVSKNLTPVKQEVFVIVGRKNNRFRFARYYKQIPPEKPGTFITITTCASGQQIRTIRNYTPDMLQEEKQALQICQQIEERVEEAAEIRRQRDYLLSDTLDHGAMSGGQRYSMSFNEEVDEATKAHLQEVANMLMADAYRLGLDQPSYAVTVRPGNVHTPPKRRTSSGMSASDLQELMDMSDTDLREIGEEIIQNLPDFRSPEKQHQDFIPQQGPSTAPIVQEPYLDPVQEVVASMRAAAQKQSLEASGQNMETPVTTSQYELPPPYMPTQTGQYTQQTYQPITHYQQPQTSGTQMMQQPQQMSQHYSQVSSNSPVPMYQQQHQFVQQPIAPGHYSIQQHSTMPETQHHEQENGLDAEYTMRQSHAQAVHSGYPIEHGDNISIQQPEIKLEQTEVYSEEAEQHPDREFSEYLVVQTNDAWQPSVIAHVPVKANNRLDFSKVKIVADSALNLNKEEKSNDDEFNSQLDEEPLMQQTNEPLNPVLVGENGQQLETELTDEEIDEDQEEESSEDDITAEQVTDMIDDKEADLKSKQQEDESDHGSENSFEFVTIDNDHLPCTSDTKANKRGEVSRKLEQVLKDHKPKKPAQQSTSRSSASKTKPRIVLNIPNAAQLESVEIDPKALDQMRKMTKPKSKSKKKSSNIQKVKFLLKSKADDSASNRFNVKEDANADPELVNSQAAEGPYAHVTNDKLRLFLHRLHKKSPKRAEEAVDYYVRRMTDLLQKTYKPKVETETDGVRVEFAHESIRLPTGHLISTMPRVHFNYLPDDVFADLQTFDEVEDEMRKEVNALADKLRTHPTLLDEDLDKLFEYQSVNSTKLDALANLRSLVDARIPPRLLSYLVGEVGQLFKLDLNGGELNEEHVQQLKTTLWLMTNLEQKRPIDFLLNSLSFVAELNESLDLQEQIDDILKPLTTCLSLEAPKIIKHILNPSFLGVLSCRRIAQTIFERAEALDLRSEFFNQLELVEELLAFKKNTDAEKSKDFEMSDETGTKDEETQQQDAETSVEKPQLPARNQRSQVQTDCFLLRLMQIFAKHSRDQFIGNERLINLVHSFWKSSTLENRYSTHRPMNEMDEQAGVVRQYFDSMLVAEKFEVPELCVRLMIDYMREHQDRIDLLFDCCIAFCHEYVTDFTFLTRYIEEEIIPLVSLEWRHSAYDRLIDFFQPKRSNYPDKECILLAKFTQHILMPVFQHAFNTQPMDDVVGAKPWPDNDENEQSIIWKFCHNIIEPYYNSDSQSCALQLPVPEALKVVLYQFCSILVQRCPDHIHSTTGRKQQRPTGTPKPSDKCLRSLMLFCWHCIQNQQPIELPEKYAGQFLIANLMEKFAISKSIINQAVSTAHQQDLRVIVSKSLEIIIPVIAGRGDEGDLQLFETIKKTMEESQQHSQIVHCIAILTKHAKVFFRVRQQVADLLIHSIQRFHSTQASLENKKLILEICETILKFENQRSDLLEKAQTQDPPSDKVQQSTPLPAIELENVQQTFDRRIIEQILQWLLRIATSTDQTALMQNHPGGDPYSLVRKALGILRRAIKPQIFGNVPLRTTHLERQLSLPQQRAQPHEELTTEQQTVVYNQVSQTLDIILAMISYLPLDSIGDFMQNLQRPISLCVSCTNMAVAQSCFKLVGKLAEQSAANAGSSLADYEILNAEIGRYLNDSMNFVASNGFSPQLTPTLSMQLISKCLALLRVICKFHPTYLEQTCFVTFLKMFQKLVLEYNPMLPLQTGPPNAADPRQKIPQDLCSCMDLLKGRLHALGMESRRAIDKELQALVDKPIFGRLKDPNHQTNAPVRRVVEKLMEMLIELVRLDAGCLLNAPMGLKLLTHVYERMHAYAPYPSDIMLKFLSAVQLVFEDKALRKCELTEKLHVPFFWGLAQIDQNVWYNFFRLFETQFPNQLFERLMHIISEQNWLPLSNRFWIPHCIHLLLRSATTAETSNLQFKNCGTFAQTASRLQSKLELEFEDDSTEFVQPTGETVENQQSTETPVQATDNAGSLDSNSQIAPAELFNSGKTLQDMLQNSANTDLSRQVAEMSQVDHRLAATVFGDLFSSLWNQMPSQGVEKRRKIAEFFIQSGQFATCNQMPLTPMHCFYVAVQKCTVPTINVDSALLEHLAVDNRLWFEAVDELERRLRHASSARLQMLTSQSYTRQMKEMDNLSSIYTQLGEEDLRAALWKKRACLMTGSFRSIELFNQSLFKEARLQCRLVMNEGKEKMFEDALIGPRKPQPVVEVPQQQPSTSTDAAQTPATEQTPNEPSTSEVKEEPMEEQAGTSQQDPALIQQQVKTPEQPEVADEQPKEAIEEPQPEIIAEHLDIRALDLEMRSLEGVWIQCCRELNDWSALTRYANCNDIANAELLGDAAWHQSEWGLVRDLAPQLEASGSRRGQFAASLLYALSLAANGEFVQRPKVDELSAYLINDWRQLPSLVTPAHMNLVRMAQRVQELAEANQVNKVAVEKIVRIQPGVHQMSTPSKQFPALITHRYTIDAELINCIKQTVKTWRNRPLTIIDPASHWSDTFTWRVQQYWSIMRMFENADNTNIAQQSQAMHPLHSISQAQIQYARTLRKNELFEEAAHELSMLHAMSQVHPIDAGITLHEQVKCLVGLAEKIRRQRKYGEKCLIDSSNSPAPPYLRIKKEPEELIESAINLLDSARLDVLSNDQLARLLAVKASIHSQFNEQNEQIADELFATSANLIENSTATTGTQSTSVTNTMAASQLVWKYWSNHWERKFNRVFATIWSNAELNIDACRNARHIALETMTTLLECMRTATDSRAKKFTARFFHFLRSAHALEELLTGNGHSIELEAEEMADQQDGDQIKTITTETVLQKHAGAVSPINWLFWLEQIIHEIRVYSSKEMAKILSIVAESYPQQVLVVLRSAIWPELITQRIKFVQERLPLISDWIQCAPPLDVTGGSASNEQPACEQQTNVSAHPYERLQAIEKLEKHEEQFASAFTLWRARRRDRQLMAARSQLIKFNQAFKAMEEKTHVNMEARKRLEGVKQQLKLKYLRLKQMQKLGLLPEASERVPRCLNMAVYEDDGISGDEDASENSADVFETRLKLPAVDSKKPFNILIDTSNVDSSEYELQMDLQMDKVPELALPELTAESTTKNERLEPWTELLLQAVDSMCIGRYADVNALNAILNDLDQIPMPWIQLAHSELVQIADFVHSETSKLAKKASNAADLKASEQTCLLMEQFNDQILLSSNQVDQMEVDQQTKEEKLRQEMTDKLLTLKQDQWPLVKLSKVLCRWLQKLEKELNGLDEIIPIRDIAPYLSSFNSKVAYLDVCSAWSPLKTQFATQISQFLPLCRRQFRPSGTVLMFGILSQNGKTYVYRMERRSLSIERQRTQQCLNLLNYEFLTNREVCRRSVQFSLPDVFHTGRNYQIMECNPMSGAPTYQLFKNVEQYGSNLKSLHDIASSCWRFDQQNSGQEPSMLWQQSEKEFEQMELGQEVERAPENNQMLSEFMRNTYPDPATHWMVRKKFVMQWALYAAAELAAGLSCMNLKEMHMDFASAQLFSTGYSFDLELNDNGDITIGDGPFFRLTSNLAEYMQVDIEQSGIVNLPGHLSGCFTAATRALATRSYSAFLHALFWDLCELKLPSNLTKAQKAEKLLKATQELPHQLAERLKSLAVFTEHNFKAVELLEQSANKESWNKLPTSQHSWF